MRFNPIKRTATAPAANVTFDGEPSYTAPPEVNVLPPSPAAALTVALKPGHHTKRNVPIWTAQLGARVERAEFSRINAVAKAQGGYWSSFGPLADHGFIFFDEQKAIAFAMLVGLPAASPATPATLPMLAWRARLLRRPLGVGV